MTSEIETTSTVSADGVDLRPMAGPTCPVCLANPLRTTWNRQFTRPTASLVGHLGSPGRLHPTSKIHSSSAPAKETP
jgi:hypothetical protein